ncbi:MAG: sorbosone dehydrogenase family protein [Candidatus Omnitrophica bacterium]|nr:sorbosone dehydrogenase family protein [Candidatus Omnitrophota bacterium]
MPKIKILSLLILFCLLATFSSAQTYPLENIQLPQGFKIELYAKGIPNARSLALGDNNTVFVGNRKDGKVYILTDRNQDYKVDKIFTLTDIFETPPNGVAYKDGSLYIGEIGRVLRIDHMEDGIPPATIKPIVITDKLPKDSWHGWKVIRFGPDGKLYIPVGSPCNTCLKSDERYGSIMRMNPDGSELEVFARGLRNSVGFDWDAETNELWFTDNGRDNLGDDLPPDELNHAPRAGMHFGFPYCFGKEISDPEFGQQRACSEFEPAAQELGPHVASLGMRFYRGEMFPREYKNQIFIAEHGSWNRSKKIGYRISLVKVKDNQVVSYEDFATGWKQGENVWGRPVDVLNMPDGSLLVSDDYAGAVYRIYYEGQK